MQSKARQWMGLNATRIINRLAVAASFIVVLRQVFADVPPNTIS